MKKIFFLIFSFYFISAKAQNGKLQFLLNTDSIKAVRADSTRCAKNDSLEYKFGFSFNPLLILSQGELGPVFEYKIKHQLYILGGAALQLPTKIFSNDQTTSYDGYTLRAGIKLYMTSVISQKHRNRIIKPYLSILAFYRYTYTDDILYFKDPNQFIENRPLISFSAWQPDFDARQTKQVFCLQILYGGEKYFKKSHHGFFDYYIGIGFRKKVRNLEEFQYYKYDSAPPTAYVPPLNFTITDYFVTLQAGFTLGSHF